MVKAEFQGNRGAPFRGGNNFRGARGGGGFRNNYNQPQESGKLIGLSLLIQKWE